MIYIKTASRIPHKTQRTKLQKLNDMVNLDPQYKRTYLLLNS